MEKGAIFLVSLSLSFPFPICHQPPLYRNILQLEKSLFCLTPSSSSATQLPCLILCVFHFFILHLFSLFTLVYNIKRVNRSIRCKKHNILFFYLFFFSTIIIFHTVVVLWSQHTHKSPTFFPLHFSLLFWCFR